MAATAAPPAPTPPPPVVAVVAPSGRRARARNLLSPIRDFLKWLGDNPYVRWIERRVGITASGLILLVITVAGWLLARQLGGRALFLLVYAGAAVLLGSYAVSRRKPPVTGARSNLPSRVREGQRITVELTLTAKRRVTQLILEERMDRFLGSTVVTPIAMISPSEPIVHSYNMVPRLRGVYKLGPMTVSWNDPFGLTRGEMTLVDEMEIMVHPATELIYDRPLTRQWEDPPIRPPRTRPWPIGFEFYGMRDYVAGDDLRRVIWRAAARTGKLMVRESEQGVTDKVVILLNTMKEAHKPGQPSETFETAVRAAASFGARAIKDGFSVTLHENSRLLAKSLRGPRARIALLDDLARVEMEDEPLTTAIERLLFGPRGGSHFIIITPYIGDKISSRLRLITETGASVLVAIIPWEETDPLTERRAIEMGAQVVHLKPGAPMGGVTARTLGAGIR